MIVWGPGFAATKHKHHCVQLVMALQGELRIRSGPRRKWISCGAALVRPDALHEIDATGVPLLLAFVDVESELGSALLRTISVEILVVEDATVASWRRHLGDPAILTAALVEPWVRNHLLPERQEPKLHPAVRRVLRAIRHEIETRDDFPLERMAEIGGLSPSRFMHVFTKSVGVPLRPYILWLRLQMACGEMMNGATIAAAAQRAGFSDVAHLNRTLRRMMGMTPGEMLQRRAATRAAFASPH